MKQQLLCLGLIKTRIDESINVITQQFKNGILPKIIDDYNVENVSQKVVKIILSYIDYVNRNVWKKDVINKIKLNLY